MAVIPIIKLGHPTLRKRAEEITEFTDDLYSSELYAEHHEIKTRYEEEFTAEGHTIKYLNLGIDFGAVAAFALLAKFDLDKQLAVFFIEKITRSALYNPGVYRSAYHIIYYIRYATTLTYDIDKLFMIKKCTKY